MVQFARDAFPGLDARRDWLVEKMLTLAVALTLLLAATCLVSWDLAVGQSLLADYQWLSKHPQVMQYDPREKNSPCETELKEVDQTKPPSSTTPPGPPQKDLKASGDSDLPSARDQCTRFLADQRVLPIMKQWIRRQFPLSRLLAADPPPDGDTAASRGYTHELQRVLVTTLNYNILPLFLGALAATAAALRNLSRKAAANELEPRDLMQVRSRILLGAFLGAVIGLIAAPGVSNGLFELSGGSATLTNATVALPPAVYAFFAGFTTGRIFTWFDDLAEKIFSFVRLKP